MDPNNTYRSLQESDGESENERTIEPSPGELPRYISPEEDSVPSEYMKQSEDEEPDASPSSYLVDENARYPNLARFMWTELGVNAAQQQKASQVPTEVMIEGDEAVRELEADNMGYMPTYGSPEYDQLWEHPAWPALKNAIERVYPNVSFVEPGTQQDPDKTDS